MIPKLSTILLFGAPGSGKGTQGKTLGTLPGFFHCACGDVFRSLDTSTRLGRAFLDYSSRGELVPDEITVELWQVQLRQKVDAHAFNLQTDILVLDGIPRNVEQAKLMEDLIEVRHIFHLTCPDRDELMRRLKQRALKDNRLDDANERVIAHRLETYEAETMPVLEYYPDDKLCTIDAQQSPTKVLHDILSNVLAERLTRPPLAATEEGAFSI